MNRLSHQILALTCATLALALGTGCGEFPESPIGANFPVEEEAAFDLQPQGQSVLSFHRSDDQPLAQFDIAETNALEAIPETDEAAEWPRLYPLGTNVALEVSGSEEGDEAADDSETEEESDGERRFANGFSDGNGTANEWKRLARATCRRDGGFLGSIKLNNRVDAGLYRAVGFSCTYVDESADSESVGEFIGVVFGGEAACKSYDDFKDALSRVSPFNGEIVHKRVYGPCSENSDEPMFQSALFITGKVES